MAVTREKPVDRDESKVSPITDPPKQTRAEVSLQARRERAGVGFLQMIGFGMGMLGKFKLLPILSEDVAAVAVHAPSIAKAAADAAAEDEKFAAAFDMLMHVGPYGAIFESVLALGLQIAANHNHGVRTGEVDPAQFGAVHPSQLLVMAGVAQTPNGDGNQDGTTPS